MDAVLCPARLMIMLLMLLVCVCVVCSIRELVHVVCACCYVVVGEVQPLVGMYVVASVEFLCWFVEMSLAWEKV